MLNTIVLALLFGAATVFVADWTEHDHVGLLPILVLPLALRLLTLGAARGRR
jgi:hypothetical protein